MCPLTCKNSSLLSTTAAWPKNPHCDDSHGRRCALAAQTRPWCKNPQTALTLSGGFFLHHTLTQLTRSQRHVFVPTLERLAASTPVATIDLSVTTAMDATGAAVLWRLAERAAVLGHRLEVVGASAEIQRTLALFVLPQKVSHAVLGRQPYLVRLGEHVWGALAMGYEALILSASLARYGTKALLRRTGARREVVLTQMMLMGCDAVAVVGWIAFLVGITVALQSAAQLRQFGAGVLVADLIGVSITRELGPLIAAIIVAGRSGSAIAAELATMVITEELDALRMMGLGPVRFLVLPRMIALLLTQPLLTIVANTIAIFGGLLVAMLYLDIAPQAFVGRLQEALSLKDIWTGLIKSVVFAWLIVLTGTLSGLHTRGGPDAVGRSTTRSVVAAIFAIVVADALASLVFYFGD
jgi:phospholipid/cholesterol/gamma-HCH transport system permease protein